MDPGGRGTHQRAAAPLTSQLSVAPTGEAPEVGSLADTAWTPRLPRHDGGAGGQADRGVGNVLQEIVGLEAELGVVDRRERGKPPPQAALPTRVVAAEGEPHSEHGCDHGPGGQDEDAESAVTRRTPRPDSGFVPT